MSPRPCSASRCTVDGIDVVQLRLGDLEVSVAPSIGNIAYEMKVQGRNLLWFPFTSLAEFQAHPDFCANPFLAPWANRLDGDEFWANGTLYSLDPSLGGMLRDGNGLPIHGLLAYSPHWQVTALESGAGCAETTSRLEFWRHPELIAQFPFAHTIEMTHRLRSGALEIATRIENHSCQPMPVAVGYHPYFQLSDCPRDEWLVSLAGGESVVLTDALIPTGERRPSPFTNPVSLSGRELNDVFTSLIRDEGGHAEFRVEGRTERIRVIYGPKYTVAIAFAPAGHQYICFEPMSALTNAFNLAHDHRSSELQSIPPGGVWQESFWIRPESR